jgi:hypothetical protein
MFQVTPSVASNLSREQFGVAGSSSRVILTSSSAAALQEKARENLAVGVSKTVAQHPTATRHSGATAVEKVNRHMGRRHVLGATSTYIRDSEFATRTTFFLCREHRLSYHF